MSTVGSRLFPHVGLVLASLISLTGCQREQVQRPPPRLVAVIVVDQLRGDELERYRPLWRHGLRQLLAEGRWYSQAHLGYGRTETAAGHATLATGVRPRVHGIIDKEFYDPGLGAVTHVCHGGTDVCGVDYLLRPTLGDRLKQRTPSSRVVAFAAKPRSAMLLGGRQPDLVAWAGLDPIALLGRHDGISGVPAWLTRYFAQVAGIDRIGRLWEQPRLPQPFAERADVGSDEVDPGHGTTFPHRLPPGIDAESRYGGWFAMPDSDRAIHEAATYAARRLDLGADEASDLLLISLGAFDSIGHAFGPESVERIAALIELDRQLGDILAALSELAGRRVLAVLTSDHGVAPTPAQARANGHRSGRVTREELIALIDTALADRYGPPPHVAAIIGPFISLTGVPAAQRLAAADTVATALRTHPAVRAAWPTAKLASIDDPLARLMAQSAHPERAGDVTVVLEPHYALATRWRGELGAEHGTPWVYDRHIPIVLWGDGVTAGRVEREVSAIDLHRTLADRLGLPGVPDGGRPLP